VGEDREAEVQAAIFEGLRLDVPSADVVNNPGRHTPQRTSAALPAGQDVTLMVMVMSPDYGSQSPVPPLPLAPGQEMHMDIPVSKQ
jgi:hypothetical protein